MTTNTVENNMQNYITNISRQREARKILRTPGHRPSLYRLARHIIGQHPANPYASWASQ